MHDEATSDAMDRRTAMSTMGGMGVVGAAALGSVASATSPRTSVRTEEMLGWNKQKMAYELPELPYAYDALEPSIDAKTMHIHHDKHHAGYVKGLNTALDQLHSIRMEKGDPGTIQFWERKLSFHAGGHFNHSLFWTGMAPESAGGGGEPTGTLAEAIRLDFGSFDKFSWAFQRAAATVEGSGWGWLVYEPHARRLLITQMENQQKLFIPGCVPLLGVDVWEHAYYLKYQNHRATYLQAFMDVINWPEIQRRYDEARA